MADPEDEGLAERPQEMATKPGPPPQPAATAADPPSFGPGTLLAGRFRIVRFVARGGMGEVYEAEDQELNERVALKTIRHELASEPRALDRFKTEIHLARKVTHPNVCRIYDVFREPGQGGVGETLFLTMELLRGQTLAEHLERQGRLGLPEALPLVRQVAQALGAAHRAGVIHRDFKSSNVVLVPAPEEARGVRAVVTDFGLARMAMPSETSRASEAATLTKQLVGTPAYMAPEQIEGDPVTAAVDVYALGVVMYEMATGQRPFSGDTPMAVMLKRLKEAPPSPRHVVKEVDPRWDAVILRCLERSPADRFASAEDAARAMVGEEVSESRRRLARRRHLRLGAAGVARMKQELALRDTDGLAADALATVRRALGADRCRSNSHAITRSGVVATAGAPPRRASATRLPGEPGPPPDRRVRRSRCGLVPRRRDVNERPDGGALLRDSLTRAAEPDPDRSDATSWRSREVGRQELPQVIEQEFGIPRAIASEALDGLELTQNG